MTTSALDINGRLVLDPISVNRVNKFYSRQHRFLRESSVISTRSKKADKIYLVTFAFDSSDEGQISNMLDLINMCRAYPYLFISGNALEDKNNSMMGLEIGDGYFMYALHEYSIESSADNQGVVLFSIQIQPVNWKAVCKSVSFLSFAQSEAGNYTFATNSMVAHRNPGESNIYSMMLKHYSSDKDAIAKDILMDKNSLGKTFRIGFPAVSSSMEEALKVKNTIGKPRVFRITAPLRSSVVLPSDRGEDGKTQTNNNAKEIELTDDVTEDEVTRRYITYPSLSIGPDVDSAIESIHVVKRNNFAQQTITDFSLAYLQYMGSLPSEISVTQICNTINGNVTDAAQNIIDNMNKFADITRISMPFLAGIDSLRVASPLVNAMGVTYCVIDGSQTTQYGESNNLGVTRFVLLESDQSDLIERGKYNLTSNTNGDFTSNINTIIEIIDVYNSSDKTKGVPAELAALRAEIIKLNAIIDNQIKLEDEQSKDENIAMRRILSPLKENKSFLELKDLDRVKYTLNHIKNYFSSNDVEGSEMSILRGSLRYIESGINNVYGSVIALAPINRYTQDINERELKKEYDRIAQYSSRMVLSGEGAPDLKIAEIFKSNGATEEEWKAISTIPFVADLSYIDPNKLRAMWDKQKPQIDAQLSELISHVVKIDGAQEIPIYNGQDVGTTHMGVTDMSHSGSQQQSAESPYSAPMISPAASGSWGTWRDTVGVKDPKRVNTLETRRGGFHKGMDITTVSSGSAGINGKPVYAIASGNAVQKKQFPKDKRGAGNYVEIDHGDGFKSRYFHLMSFAKSGQVKKGDMIGYVGGTGDKNNTLYSPHLHLEIWHNGTFLDPERFIRNNPDTFYTWNHGFKKYNIQGFKASPSVSDANDNRAALQNATRSQEASVSTPKKTFSQAVTESTVKSMSVDPNKKTFADKALESAEKNKSEKAAATSSVKKKVESSGTNPFPNGGDKSKLGVASKVAATVTHNRNITGLTVEETRLYLGGLASIESSGNLGVVNSGGFLGLYQMGSYALQEAGYVKYGIGGDNSKLNDPRNWLNGYNKQMFLANRSLQDDAIVKYSNDNIRRVGNKNGYNSMSVANKMGFLGATHNGGPTNGPDAYLKGANKKDGNGKNHGAFGREVAWVASGISGGNITYNAGSGTGDEFARQNSTEMENWEFNPIPWDEALQGELRVNNMGKDFSIGLEKLIPTYKVYLVHGNNENSIQRLINMNTEVKYFELQSVRNIKIEMSNDENPVSMAYFEVLNAMSAATDPSEIGTQGSSFTQVADVKALSSDYSTIAIYDQIRLKAGNKLQIRLGYGNDPNSLETIFNGVITETDSGEVVRVVAESYGRELHNTLLFDADPLSAFGSLTDMQYVSTAAGRILGSADLEHFGPTAKLFGDANTSWQGTQDQKGIMDGGFSLNNEMFGDGTFLFYRYATGSSLLENYFLQNIDKVDSFFRSKFMALFPFSREHLFRDFRVSNKTIWDVLETATNMFPSSIKLVKNLGARATTFIGIKEQLMIGRDMNSRLLANAANNMNAEKLEDAEEALKENAAPAKEVTGKNREEHHHVTYGVSEKDQSNIKNNSEVGQVVDVDTKKMIEEQTKNNQESTNNISNILKDYKRVPKDVWTPATNFHIFSSSHNILSNQIKLNASCYTGVKTEYGTDMYKFGSGELDVFSLAANGNLYPSFIKEKYHVDTTVESLAMAMRVSQGVVIKELEKMYDGALIITGNPMVAPGDYACISDSSRNMAGIIKCREVQHVFNEVDGYITIITPGMYVEPASHLYSLLYLKMALFSSYVLESLDEVRYMTVFQNTAGSMYSSITMNSDMRSNIGWYSGSITTDTTIGAAGNIAVGAGSAYLSYAGAKALSSVMFQATRWAGQVMSAASFGTSTSTAASSGSFVTKSMTVFKNIRTVVSTTLAMRGAVTGVGGLSIKAIIIAILVAVAAGIIYGIADSFIAQKTLQHKATLKFPLRVNGKEYTAGLRGWNDTMGLFESQWNNIKNTYDALFELNEAASEAGENGNRTRLLWKVITD